MIELGEALEGELVRSRGMVVSVDTAGGPLRMIGNPIRCADAQQDYRVPPRLHEHTREILSPADPERGQAS